MSVKYRNASGQETIIAGLTPGGDIEAGAVDTRSGTVEIPAITSGTATTVSVTFDTAFDDNNYEVILSFDENSTDFKTLELAVYNKRANGFNINALRNYSTDASAQTIAWKAWKIYSVQHAQQNAEAIADIQAAMPADAGSGNKLVTKSYVDNADTGLGTRIASIEDAVPTTASITNKLVTQTDLDNVQIDALGDITDVDVTGVQDGQTIIWDDANSKWINGQGGKTYTAGDGIEISNADVISTDDDYVPFTFVGTKAEWDALTTVQKAKYTLVDITDDPATGSAVVVDTVANNNMNPVTSNAVYDALATKQNSTDNNLTTTAKTVVGGINELNEGLDKIIKRIYKSSGSVTVGAQGGTSISMTAPTGYELLGFMTKGTGSTVILPRTAYETSNGTWIANFANVSSSSITTTIDGYFICAKTAYVDLV